MSYYKKVSKKIITTIFTIIFVLLSLKLAIFYIPFLIAFVISLFIEPIIKFISKITNFTRKTSAIITLIIVFTIIISLLIWGITTIISETSKMLSNLNLENLKDDFIRTIKKIRFEKIKISDETKNIIINTSIELYYKAINILKEGLNNILAFTKEIPTIIIYIGITIVGTYFVCTDKLYILDQIEHHLPRAWVNKLGKHIQKIISSLGNYLKAQAILVLITFGIVLIGLYLLKIIGIHLEFPFLAALGIGLVDALPIVGAGSAIIPWAVISSLNGNIKLGISLLIIYAITVITKQIIEPKIISSKIGVHPIFTLIAMYTGFKFIGIIGMFVGPILLIIFKNIFEEMLDKGVMKSILDKD